MGERDYVREAVDGIDAALRSIPTDAIDRLVSEIAKAERIFFTGAGRSFLMLKTTAMALMQIGYRVHATGDVSTPSVAPGDLLVVASSSGETRSVLLFVEQAHSSGARIALLTANPDSAMGRLADVVLPITDGTVPGSPNPAWNTGSFFELALAPLGDVVVEILAVGAGATHETVGHNHANLE